MLFEMAASAVSWITSSFSCAEERGGGGDEGGCVTPRGKTVWLNIHQAIKVQLSNKLMSFIHPSKPPPVSGPRVLKSILVFTDQGVGYTKDRLPVISGAAF